MSIINEINFSGLLDYYSASFLRNYCASRNELSTPTYSRKDFMNVHLHKKTGEYVVEYCTLTTTPDLQRATKFHEGIRSEEFMSLPIHTLHKTKKILKSMDGQFVSYHYVAMTKTGAFIAYSGGETKELSKARVYDWGVGFLNYPAESVHLFPVEIVSETRLC